MSKFYITTTLPYINSDPHLGFALEIVQADVIARYYRQKGYEVFFNTGTDEHGLKIFRKANDLGLSPKEYCDIYSEKFRKLKDALYLSYNSFIRTTDSRHIKAAQEFWKRCAKNNDIYKGKYKIKYCVGCEMEKTDSDLVNGRCFLHPNQDLEVFEEENYFFRYSKYQKKLLNLYQKNPQFVLPKERMNEIINFTRKGLKDFSISRVKEKMSWGVPVPGDEEQVMFVWFDALVNYISCLGWPDDLKTFNDFWPGLQVAGKDNLRQQTSMWQAMLMSAGLSPSRQVFIHGFITSNGQKMSKSLGNVINPFDLVNKYSTDAVRYYLLREIPPSEDGDFTYEKFEKRYNSDLAAGLGNLTARVMKIAEISHFRFSLIRPAEEFKIISKQFQNKNFQKTISDTLKKYQLSLENFKFNEALIAVWDLIGFCDKYIEKERPWEQKDQKVISDLLFAIEQISYLLQPILPQTADKILKQLKTHKSEILFPKI